MAKIGLPVPPVKSKGGAPKGNRNALKTGRHTAEIRALRHRLADFRRRAKAAIAAAEAMIEAHEAAGFTTQESEARPLARNRP